MVFFAIGFETTTPPTALIIHQARKLGLKNFSVFCNHVLTPAAIGSILDSPEAGELGLLTLDGFVGPAHVSTVIGSQPYERFAEEYSKPIVIAGFEPNDVILGILMLLHQIKNKKFETLNEYSRVVKPEGNKVDQEIIADVFQ